MTIPAFQQTQRQFAGHLRNPEVVAPPPGVEDRRMAIYRELIYNNIENFLASGFPVLHSILSSEHWHGMVRDFIVNYRCQTPYFLEIGQEFLRYLQESREAEGWEPPFMLELCHYEWVELALDTSTDELPDHSHSGEEPLETIFRVSPLVWRLVYSYPVHKISDQFQPEEPAVQGIHLVVYRNADDEVKFLEINAIVSRMIQLIESKEVKLNFLLSELAEEVRFPDFEAFLSFARPIIIQLLTLSIILPVEMDSE